MPNEIPPADAGNGTPPAGASGSPTTVIDHEEGNEIMENLTPGAKAYIKQLRGEAKDHRLEKARYKDQFEKSDAELKAIKADAEAKETERLEKEQQFQKLYEQEKQGRTSDRQRIIDAEIKVLAAEKGLPVKTALKLLDRNGISIDSEGNISGIDRAWERMEEEYEEVFEPVRSKAAAKAKSEDDEEDADDKKKAGKSKEKDLEDGEKYGDRRKRVGAGGDPPPKSAKKTVINAREMKKPDADKAYAEWKAKHPK